MPGEMTQFQGGSFNPFFLRYFFPSTQLWIWQKAILMPDKKEAGSPLLGSITALQKKEVKENEDKWEKRAERGKMSHPARHYPISQDLFSQLSEKAMHDEFVKSLFSPRRSQRKYF